MKNISQQLETSTSELTKFRSNTNEGSSLSRNKELNVDTYFTQVNLGNNVNDITIKEKEKQLQRQLFKKDKCKEHSTNTTIDRENFDFCIACDNPGDLICCDICPRTFHLECIGEKKKEDVEPSKDNIKNHHDVTSCQVYDKDCEITSITKPNHVNQDEKTRLSEIKGNSEKAQDIKTDLAEYIKERSKDKQQIISNICRKNQKLLDSPVHRKKNTFTKSR